jgi:hypothetical protein
VLFGYGQKSACASRSTLRQLFGLHDGRDLAAHRGSSVARPIPTGNYGYKLFRRLARCLVGELACYLCGELAMVRLLSSFSALEMRRHIPSQLACFVSQAYTSCGVARLLSTVATSLAVATGSQEHLKKGVWGQAMTTIILRHARQMSKPEDQEF